MTQSRVFINSAHVSGYMNHFKCDYSRTFSDVSNALSTGTQWLPGLIGGSIAVDGMYNDAAGSLSTVMQAAIGTDNGELVTLCPAGTALGTPCFMAICDPSEITIDAKVTDAVMVKTTGAPDDGIDMGIVLHTFQAETATANGTGVDNAASTANGGVGLLHLTTFSGLTNIIVKIDHSTDNVTFTNLITFSTAVGVTQQRSTVSGTVNRYLRASWTVTGTGSASFIASFARR